MAGKLISFISLIWAGMILGISFLESWVKFRAPNLTKAVGLEVGRLVFSYFHYVQYGLCLAIIITSLCTKLLPSGYTALIGLIIVFLIQSTVFLPSLNNRVSLIIAGNQPPPSHVHAYYGVAEIIKLLLLCYLGINLMA